MIPAIEARALGVRAAAHFWRRPRALLHDVTFEVAPGEICGFLGPNGAGKTTTMRVLLGLLRPCTGEARLFGLPAGEPAARVGLGFLPERSFYPGHLTAHEFVLAHARLAGLRRADAVAEAAATLRRVGLEAHAKRTLRTFSKGMLQRTGLAQALVGRPRLLVLDEPLSGLDPAGRHLVRQIIAEEGARGCAVFFSTHVLSDVELVCQRVAILAGGRMRHHGTPAELAARAGAAGGSIEVVAADVDAEALAAASALCQRTQALTGGHRFVAADAHAAHEVARLLLQRGARLQLLAPTGGSRLEHLFTEEPAHARP